MKTRLPAFLAAVLAVATPLPAATVNWTSSTVAGASDVRKAGTLVGAINAGDTVNARTVNGVSFAADPGGAGPLALGSATVSFGNLDSDFNDFWTLASPGGSAEYAGALDYGRYGPAGNGTITLGGLTAGRKYLVQLWIVDTRGGTNTRIRTVDGVATTSGGPNIVTGSFVADAATQVITLADAGSYGPQVNMLQLRDVPATWTTSTVSGTSDVSTAGTLVGAMNVGASLDAMTVNGVTFAVDPGGAGTLALGSATVAFGNLATPYEPFWTLADPHGSFDYGIALDSGRYGPAGNGTVTLGGLTAGRKYLVQLWIVDTRGGANTRVRTVDDASTISGGPNIATGTFVAESPTQVIALADTGSFGPQVNMLQVRDLTLRVSNTSNAGAGSLRQAILDANASAGADTIEFDAALAGQTITLTSGGMAPTDAALTTVDASALAAPVVISAGGNSRVFRILTGTSVLLRGLILRDGDGTSTFQTGDGGAIISQGTLTVEDCEFRSNVVPGSGGAIYAVAGSTLTVTRCSFSGNEALTANETGGAIHTLAPTVISQSTFSGNSAGGGGAVLCNGSGTLTISQSTFTGNSASAGGALACSGTGSATLTHVTISGNHATATGVSGGGLRITRPLSLAYCIVAGNTSAGAAADIENQNTLTYAGSNLVQTVVNSGAGTGSGPAPLIGAPQLAPLGIHGGPWQTRPPLSTSPALNAAAGSTITTDQRGYAVTGVPDLGACEHSISLADLPDQTINEDANGAGRTFPCTIEAASYTSPAPTFSAVSSNPALVTSFSFPGTTPNRSVRVFLAPDANGTAVITVTVTRGGESATRSFLLTVTPVNDVPEFTLNPSLTVNMNAEAASYPVASGISDGDPEVAQTLTFLVTNDNNSLFSVQPAIAADGTLTFTPVPWQTGSATVTVRLQDDGSGVSPNVNLSAAQTLSISVNAPAALSVTNTFNSGAGSLRDQIAAALSAGGARLILFDPGLSGQTITLSSEIVLNDPTSADMLSIDASSLPGGLTINGGAGTNRIFTLAAGDRATLRGITLTGGNGTGAINSGYGGAICSLGTLTLTRCTLSGNSADVGGAAYNVSSQLLLTQCTLSNNSAILGGGAVVNTGLSATLTLTQCTLAGNSATAFDAEGGALHSSGNLSTLTLTNCLVAENSSIFGPDIYFDSGTLIRSGVNLIGKNDTVATQFPAGLPNANGDYAGTVSAALISGIAPLGNYGGPTQTRPPMFASPAINAVGAEVQRVALAGSLIGQFSLTFEGAGTPLLGGTSTAVAVQEALNGLPTIHAGGSSVRVTKSGNVFTVVFNGGPLAGMDVPQMTATVTGALTATVTTPWEGAAVAPLFSTDQRGVAISGPPDIGASENIVPAISVIADLTVAEDSSNAARTLACTVSDAPGYTGTPVFHARGANTALVPSITPGGSGSNRTLLINVPADAHGSDIITVYYHNTFTGVQQTFALTVAPVADTPSVTSATTDEDTQSTTGLVVARNSADAAEVTHFKITGITNGTLFKNDGTTQIPDASFLKFVEVNAGLKFSPAADFNGTGSFTLQASTSDSAAGLGGSPVAAIITVTPVNDAPAATNLSAAETWTEEIAINLADILITDPDTATVTATLTLSVPAAGSLSTATSGAVTSAFSAATGVWTATGPLANVNTLLAGVTFTPAANFSTSFEILTSVSDGVAPALTGSKTMAANPVNDPPTATNLFAPETYTEDTTLNLTNIVITDPDNAPVTATLTLSVPAAGRLSTATSGTVTSSYIAASGVWTATGPVANVNTLLAGVSYIPAANYNAGFDILTSVSDGVAPALTGTKAMTGTAVEDPPTLAALSNLVLAPGTGLQTVILSGIGTGAADEVQTLTITATSSNQTFLPDPAVTYTSPDAAGSLSFTPAAGQTGFALVTVTVSDGITTISRTFYVSIPVNPASNVTHPGDSGSGSLRQAISAALGLTGSRSITFDPVLSGQTIILSSEIVLNDPNNTGTDTLTLDATSLPGGLTIDGGPGTNRIFSLPEDDRATLRGLTLTGGNGTGAITSGYGGAVFFSGTLTLEHCTLTGNSAQGSLRGGAMAGDGTLTMTYCTLSGNSAGSGGAMGGGGTVSLTHCTLSGNSAADGGAISQNGTLTLTNSLIAGNTAPTGPDIRLNSGTITRSGVNLIGNLSGSGLTASAALLTGDAQLDPLANNGGPTQTMRLLPGSPALNRITTPLFPTDQRGFPIVGPADIGAYENGAPTIATIADQVALSGVTTAPIAFTIGDAETAAASLTVTGTSSNTTLVPNANFLFDGTDANRTVAITPASGETGTATITVTVSDGANTTSTSFQLTVLANTPYNTWKLAHLGPNATNPALAGDTADADNDGLDTLHEYAAGANPLAYTAAPLTATPAPGGGMVFTFPWNPQAPDLRYRLQESPDLSTWSDLYQNDRTTSQIIRAPGVTSDETTTPGIIIVTIPAATGARTFWKLHIEQP